MNYKKIFKRWMKENGYWKAFKGVEGNNYLSRPESFKPENYIICTFSWHIDAYTYWLTVHSEWTKYLKSTKKKLKPCPFCGSDVHLIETEGCDYVIVCDDCGVQMFDDMSWGIKGFNAKKNVIEKWNKRGGVK